MEDYCCSSVLSLIIEPPEKLATNKDSDGRDDE